MNASAFSMHFLFAIALVILTVHKGVAWVICINPISIEGLVPMPSRKTRFFWVTAQVSRADAGEWDQGRRAMLRKRGSAQ